MSEKEKMKKFTYSILFSFTVFCSAYSLNAQEIKNNDAWRRIALGGPNAKGKGAKGK